MTQGNRIGDDGAEKIAQGLAINNKLTELYMWVRLALLLLNSFQTNSPFIQENHIGDKGTGKIAETLKINNTLTILYLAVRFTILNLYSIKLTHKIFTEQPFWSRRRREDCRSIGNQQYIENIAFEGEITLFR